MDPFRIMRWLLDQGNEPKFTEVYHKLEFEGWRAGGQKVKIEVFDSGESTQRFHVVATADNGKSAAGNHGDTLDEALSFVHWDELD